jgi:uncharacterized protein (TIGR00106 family)
MVVAEFSITPLVEGELKPFVDAAIDVVKESGLKYEVDALGTTIEGELGDVLSVVKKAHLAVRNMGAGRVMTELKIDEKAGGETIEQELEGYRQYQASV